MRTAAAMPMVLAGAISLAAVCHFVSEAHGAAQVPSSTHRLVMTDAPWNRMASVNAAEGRVDPLIFFDELVARYRGLRVYSDLTHIVQVTRQYDDESEPQRTETRVASEVSDGKLNVVTPGSQLRRNFGLNLPVQASPEMEQAKLRYDLWLLPHMALKFAEQPLQELREGVPEGFTATEAAAVTIDDRPMVHLELTSGDGLSGDYNARFDLYVDPESMLIERIEGRQRLPDGGDFETTYYITPTKSEGGEPVARPSITGDDPTAQPASTPATAMPQQPDATPTEPNEHPPRCPGARPSKCAPVG